MDIKVSKKHLRIAPRKARLVADLTRNCSLKNALEKLALTQKKATDPIAKLIKSARAVAIDKEMEEGQLYIKSIQVDEGPTLKRRQHRSKGRSTVIRKRTSHIKLVVSEKDENSNKSETNNKIR